MEEILDEDEMLYMFRTRQVDIRDCILDDLRDEVLCDMNCCISSNIPLEGGLLTVIEFNDVQHHYRFIYKPLNDERIGINKRFDTLFDGVEKMIPMFCEKDAEIIWNWFVENQGESK